jgi:hypothetical protein
MPGKRVHIDDETWHVFDLLAKDKMATFQELADEAFADLLKKHDRPVVLKDALLKSAGRSADSPPVSGAQEAAAPEKKGAPMTRPLRPLASRSSARPQARRLAQRGTL